MQAKMIFEYHDWVKRGYLEPLECPSCQLNLIPVQQLDHMALHCPRCAYKKELGLSGYADLEIKLKLARWAFRTQ